ncbi:MULTISPECIES: protein-methionine-sulfoxide reductase heme-binding subunit MsrQ [Halocynthiibacter]|uniref:Protein-methionine-sulfoxide reductase heme-binding subunit MsrQ n=1 Tax=Halocynthiibacter halioticoli TaxID=2986804 RepID=A0AAE3J2Q0_9RHOB|nr:MULTISPECIES: protein-methionine-sulfoxide reductase heme-binding subunit MsrQ [Halocynthiibacter]MCV6825770.1 protein-methionine-sulfoxide reductase heme-binding subunit MsrQ [Halocynthiibacter halioticoli]MCW4058771.1 protein-methionine-sulfoxide reductase heme-binding subunit MsrQ [Halocynthiibacter sp. SDUM655004]
MTSLVQSLNSATRKIPAWILYVLGMVPVAALTLQLFNGQLGIDPVKTLEHELGEIALQLLIAGLAITPLRNAFGLNLIKFRRAIGLLAFAYVVMHLGVWLFLDMQLLMQQILKDLVKRWYITIGMFGLLLMIPLALTSNNLSLRKLGAANWRKLHKLTYGAVLAGAIHYVILVKGWQLEPLIYLAIVVLLLAMRIPPLKRVRLV